jgi:hypothetical protein
MKGEVSFGGMSTIADVCDDGGDDAPERVEARRAAQLL